MPFDPYTAPQPNYLTESVLGYLERMKVPSAEVPEAARALAEKMSKDANSSNSLRCLHETHYMFLMPWTEALVPGHIYSDMGEREALFSGICEWCFDIMFKDNDED